MGNPHIGSTLDELLELEGAMAEETTKAATRYVLSDDYYIALVAAMRKHDKCRRGFMGPPPWPDFRMILCGAPRDALAYSKALQMCDGILRANSALEADRRCILRRMRRLLRDGVRP